MPTSKDSTGCVVKVTTAMNTASLFFVIAERAMGPTILGNVIFLGLALLLALGAGLVGAVHLFEQPSKNAAAINPAISFLLIAYVVVRFVSDSVPAGYGP